MLQRRCPTGLLRSGLLKRFESSPQAFGRTCARMAASCREFVKGLDGGVVLSGAEIKELAETDGDEAWEELLVSRGRRDAAAYEADRLRADAASDAEALESFAAAAAALPDDPKAAALIETLAKVAADAAAEAVGPDDLRGKRKVLVFSYFADTLGHLDAVVREAVESDGRLADYRGRVATVCGAEGLHGVSRSQAVLGFAPRSSDAPPSQEDRFDILLTTDVLSEGVNLQDCRNLINFDLPWNPMRLVQRHGRIDRIGSVHTENFLYCLFPDARLNDLLALEGRIRTKLAQATASIGIEAEVLPGSATGGGVYADEAEQVRRLREGDATLLTTGGAEEPLSGEEFRTVLAKALSYDRERIEQMPHAAGSGLMRGPERGHFFCARVGDRTEMRFVPAGGGPVDASTLRCLSRIACGEREPRHLPDDLRQDAYAAWDRARADVAAKWAFETDPKNLAPKVPRFLRQAVLLLRTHPPAGVDDRTLQSAIDSIDADLLPYVRARLQEAFDPDAPQTPEAAARLLKEIRALGLRPVPEPKGRPPIREEDIRLICWMAVEREADPD